MRCAVIDGRLGVRVLSKRPLVYTRPADLDEDRPLHVRAGSGLALIGDTMYVVQDDASFIARVRGNDVDAITLPHAPHGRRRFEIALGNKLDKLDLEACVAIDGELIAFGSGSLPVRECVCRVRGDRPELVDGTALYANIRDAIGSPINLEGSAAVDGELWLFHRGNTGPSDPGPAVARVRLAAFLAWLDGAAAPPVIGVDRYDLGGVAGYRIGFTDAVSLGDRVFYLGVAEQSADAIADGSLLDAQIGVIAGDQVRATQLCLDHQLAKAEGLLLDPRRRRHGWITADPDDPETPTPIYEIEITGDWW